MGNTSFPGWVRLFGIGGNAGGKPENIQQKPCAAVSALLRISTDAPVIPVEMQLPDSNRGPTAMVIFLWNFGRKSGLSGPDGS
jgi:hypothetical protein